MCCPGPARPVPGLPTPVVRCGPCPPVVLPVPVVIQRRTACPVRGAAAAGPALGLIDPRRTALPERKQAAQTGLLLLHVRSPGRPGLPGLLRHRDRARQAPHPGPALPRPPAPGQPPHHRRLPRRSASCSASSSRPGPARAKQGAGGVGGRTRGLGGRAARRRHRDPAHLGLGPASGGRGPGDGDHEHGRRPSAGRLSVTVSRRDRIGHPPRYEST